jgi:hypothetical protein
MIPIRQPITCFLISAMVASAAYGQTPPPPPPPLDLVLTSDQLAKVKTVLAKYKANSLTVEDAKTIKRTLRDLGMRKSKGLDDALNAAGFSPQKLDALDPPPPRPPEEAAAPIPRASSPIAATAPKK